MKIVLPLLFFHFSLFTVAQDYFIEQVETPMGDYKYYSRVDGHILDSIVEQNFDQYHNFPSHFKTEFKYDEFGRIQIESHYSRFEENDDWKRESNFTTLYNSDGKVILSIEKDDRKISNVYENNLLIESENSYFVPKQKIWRISTLDKLFYNKQGILTERITFERNGELDLNPSQKEEFFFSDKKERDSIVGYGYYNGEWKRNRLKVIEQNDTFIIQRSFRFFNDKLEEYYTYKKFYNPHTHISEIQQWVTDADSMRLDSSDKFFLNSDSMLVKQIAMVYDKNIFNYRIVVSADYERDEWGRLLNSYSYIYHYYDQTYDSSWVNLIYDDVNKTQMISSWDAENNTWKPERKIICTFCNDYLNSDAAHDYIEKNQFITSEYQTYAFINGNWIFVNRLSYYYSTLNLLNKNDKANQYILYPVPCKDELYIDKLDSYATMLIYTKNGLQIESAKIQPYESINVAGLTNGLYLYKIIADQKIETGKFIKQD